MEIIRETDLGIGPVRRGKVRDCYTLDNWLLLVATDRISAFDVVMPGGIPSKGKVLNTLSAFWFDRTRHVVENHIEATEAKKIVALVPALAGKEAILEGRTSLCRRTEPVAIECVVRGYLAGSAWQEYKQHGTVAELPMPKGMKENQRFDKPLFTPSIKAETGHDENISIERMRSIIGVELADRIIDKSLALFEYASEYARGRGILIADTKFEFGLLDGRLVLIDEIFTPDSSRFWLAENYRAGEKQKGFDKQPLRDWLQNLTDQGKWDKTPPGPELPADVVSYMSDLYKTAYRMITGKEIG